MLYLLEELCWRPLCGSDNLRHAGPLFVGKEAKMALNFLLALVRAAFQRTSSHRRHFSEACDKSHSGDIISIHTAQKKVGMPNIFVRRLCPRDFAVLCSQIHSCLRDKEKQTPTNPRHPQKNRNTCIHTPTRTYWHVYTQTTHTHTHSQTRTTHTLTQTNTPTHTHTHAH